MATTFIRTNASVDNFSRIYAGTGTWVTANSTTANEWAWTDVGTTTAAGVTYAIDIDATAEGDDIYFTGTVHYEPVTIRGEMQIDGRRANYDDFFRVVAGQDPAWVRANETQEDKVTRERHVLVRDLVGYGARISGAQIDEDPEFDLERVIGIGRQFALRRWAEMEHYLPLTEEEVRETLDLWQRRREETIESRRLADERQRIAATADRRAELLLISLLSRKQKEEWLKFRHVTEVAPSGRVWRLFPEWSGGACIMDGNVRRATLCVHGAERVPNVDNMVMLLMTIRGDEERLIRVGILHGGAFSEAEREIRRVPQAVVDAQRAA